MERYHLRTRRRTTTTEIRHGTRVLSGQVRSGRSCTERGRDGVSDAPNDTVASSTDPHDASDSLRELLRTVRHGVTMGQDRDFGMVVGHQQATRTRRTACLDGAWPTNDAEDFSDVAEEPGGRKLPRRTSIRSRAPVRHPMATSPTVSDIERLLRGLYTRERRRREAHRTAPVRLSRRARYHALGCELALLHAVEARRLEDAVRASRASRGSSAPITTHCSTSWCCAWIAAA